MDAVTSQAEIDRDALLQAIGFVAGPLGEGLRRKVILDNAGGLRGAMVKARRAEGEHEAAAGLWWLSCAEGEQQPLLLRVWQERQATNTILRAVVAELQRVTDAAEMLARETSDPGSEALAAIYSAREALRRAGLGPIIVAPLLDERMFWFLSVLQAAGGDAPASDDPGEWVAAFCDDREPTDTYNLAEDLGFTRTTHDNRSDNSTVRLTDLGREALALDSRSGGAA